MTLFDNVTLLVTHYNRSSSLERLLQSFSDLDCGFSNVVVSDDGSKPEHISKLRDLAGQYKFDLVTSPVNKGLGNNINKGQDAVKTPLTLYVQEDFVPKKDFVKIFSDALSLMQERKDLDVVRFYAYFKYPYLSPLNNGFNEMQFKLSKPGYKKFYYYSDHPHLRRDTFFTKFGRYPEGLKVEITEYKMMMSFLKNGGKAAQYEDIDGVFDQRNSIAEPSTVRRNIWRESENVFLAMARHFYRHIKFNADYLR